MGDEVVGVNLLGAFAIAVDGRRVPDDVWRLRKAKALVKLLALTPEHRLHADQVAETLWPEHGPAATRNNLHQAIYAARRALDAAGAEGHALLELSDDLISFGRGDSVEVDADLFEAAAARARAAGDRAAFRDALALYTGELLPEDRYEEWTASRRESLRGLRLSLAIELAELLAETEPAAAIELLREVLVEEPLHEPTHRELMRLYVGAGRRQEALAQFLQLRRGLEREFADQPDERTRELYRRILSRSFGTDPSREQAPPAAEGAPSRPRQLTSFVGRERELGETAALLAGTRLLTLTGAGGCGKTRLALELVRQRAPDFDGAVWVVELAGLGDSALVPPALAQALGTRLASGRAPELTLAEFIGERRVLIVLDNCEHLIEPVAALAEALLARCPRLTVLATSRELLRVPGEVAWRVPSLALPQLDGDGDPGESLAAESVRLFAARAAQASPGFELGAANAGAVAALVHRLDGMPLAIELASARVGALTPAQIVARLDGSLDLLSAGSRTAVTRQQTLRATLAWSFDLLEPAEQVLLRRLAVFAGGFGAEAVEAICGEDGAGAETFSVFGRLLDKSLIQVEEDEDAGRRFRLLETVRQFAAEQLDAAAERAAYERRHREWYAALAASDPTPAGDLPALRWLQRLDVERDNLRAALATGLADDPQIGLRLAVSLWGFWLMRGYLAEAYRWFEGLLAAAPEPTEPRARALLAVSMISVRRGGYERIEEFAAESVEIFAARDDPAGMFDAVEAWSGYRLITGSEAEIEGLVDEYGTLDSSGLPAARPAAWAAQARGVAAWTRRQPVRARAEFERGLSLLEGLDGEPRPALWPISYCVVWADREFGYPFTLQEETMLIARRVGAEAAAGYALVNLAMPVWATGESGLAAELLEDGLARFQALGDRQGEASVLNALGNLARRDGDFERGREHLALALALREEIGDRRGAGITLACTGLLLARAGDPAAARTAADRACRWFAADDDMIGLSAAGFSLAAVALSEGDRESARAELEAVVKVLANLGSSHQEAWLQAALAALCAEDEEPAAARRWLRGARRRFEQLGTRAGGEYCDELERSKRLQSAN